MYNLKMRQIERETKEIINAQKKRADFQKKLADKRRERQTIAPIIFRIFTQTPFRRESGTIVNR